MIRKFAISLAVVAFLISGVYGFILYQRIYQINVKFEEESKLLYIPTGSSFFDVKSILEREKIISNSTSFEWVAEKKNYINLVKPGCYRIYSGWNNEQLVDLLRSGDQEPVKVTFNNLRFVEQLAGTVSEQLEPDSTSLLEFLNSDSLITVLGFNKETYPALFIPNTYEFYWNTSPADFMSRVTKEFKAFWSEERKAKAVKLGLSQSEVSTLASIVESETNKNDEKPRVAGVYLNRLRKGMLLQADPTLIFATRDWNARRVLNKHKEVDSPYNTYKYKGLPPGPIRIPEISSIDAVLNAEFHNYLYFCAREDFSGYHSFASTYREHKRNARRFQAALNSKGVYK